MSTPIAWKSKDGRVATYKRKGFDTPIYTKAELSEATKVLNDQVASQMSAENLEVSDPGAVKKGEYFTLAGGAKPDKRSYFVTTLSDGREVWVKGDKKASQTWATKNAGTLQLAAIALNAIPGVGTALSVAAGTALAAHQASQGTISKDAFWKGVAINVASAGVASKFSGASTIAQAGAQAGVRAVGAKWQGASTSEALKQGAVQAAGSVAGAAAGGAALDRGYGATAAVDSLISAGATYAAGSMAGLDNETLRGMSIQAALSGGIRGKAAGEAGTYPSLLPRGASATDAAASAIDSSLPDVTGLASQAIDSAIPAAPSGASMPVATASPTPPPAPPAPSAPDVANMSVDDLLKANLVRSLSPQPKSWAERNAVVLTVGVPAVTALASAYMNKQSTDKQIAATERGQKAALERSEAATERTNALYEEYFTTAESSSRPKISSVWS